MGNDNVIPIKSHENQETIKALEGMLKMAERGDVTGVIFALQLTGAKYTLGSAGYYRNHPLAALGVVGRLFSVIDEAAQESGDQV